MNRRTPADTHHSSRTAMLPPLSFARMAIIAYMYFLTVMAMLGFVGGAVGSFTFAVLAAPLGKLLSVTWLLISIAVLVVGIVIAFLIANIAQGMRLGASWGWKAAAGLSGLAVIVSIALDIAVHVTIHHYHTIFNIPVVITLAFFGLLFLPDIRHYQEATPE